MVCHMRNVLTLQGSSSGPWRARTHTDARARTHTQIQKMWLYCTLLWLL